MKLLNKAIDISIKKMLSYHNEIYMVFINSLLSVLTTILFWKILFNNMSSFAYSNAFIYILAMVGLISDGLSEVFFGLRDFEYLVVDGSLDSYLYKPKNPLYLIIIERIPVIPLIQKTVLGIIGLTYVFMKFNVQFSFLNLIYAIFFMALGIVYYHLVYGIFTLFSLNYEKISSIRDLIFQFNESKKYPITIFPKFLVNFLTYVVPMSLVAYYPTVILLGIEESLPKMFFSLPIVLILATVTYKKCMNKYSSNGG
ncbi:MAG: ABC-2 family transporter protein [Oscillospiraceae bacterium]